jgi:hypothetical protein
MSLPEFNAQGNLPVAVHLATLEEVLARFGNGTKQREAVTARLLNIHQLAKATGKLLRFVIFGSYVTSKPNPNDVDIILVMSNDFKLDECDQQSRPLFFHQQAQQQMGASIFWTTPAAVIGETVDEFIAYWQVTRGSNKRGIVEVIL